MALLFQNVYMLYISSRSQNCSFWYEPFPAEFPLQLALTNANLKSF